MTRTNSHADPAADVLTGLRPSLQRYARRLERQPADAEDLVQETMRRGLQAARNGRQPHDMSAYLFRTMRNLRTDTLRRKPPAGSESLDEPAVPGEQEGALYCAQVFEIMRDMSEIHRSVLLCVAQEGLTVQETATRLGVPEGTVLSRLNRARAALRARLLGQ